jgi:hypothetical protein
LRSLRERGHLSADEYTAAVAKFVELSDLGSMDFMCFVIDRDLDLQADSECRRAEREREAAEETTTAH